jgi:hypothetical protein
MEVGFGRMDVRLGAVEERRWSGAGREGAGWADIMRVELVADLFCGIWW